MTTIKIIRNGLVQVLATISIALGFITEDNGSLLSDITWEMGDDSGNDALSLQIHLLALLEQQEAKLNLRRNIELKVGDTPSILGTTADGASLGLVTLAELSRDLATATTLAEVRAAAEPLATLFSDLLTKLDSGEVKLTCEYKGRAEVLTEVGKRSTAVVESMSA